MLPLALQPASFRSMGQVTGALLAAVGFRMGRKTSSSYLTGCKGPGAYCLDWLWSPWKTQLRRVVGWRKSGAHG